MAKQISDEEYAFLQNKRMTADFVESIYNDPQLTKEAKRLIKRKYPNLAIPDYDIEEKVNTTLEADRKERKDAEDAARQKREDDAWRSTRKKTQDAYGFTDEAMGEMEKWMQEKGVGDYEVAAEYRASKNPKTSDPGGFDSQFWQHDKAPQFKEIAADPEAWGRKEILGAIGRDNERARANR
jgi:hypothetical protein